MTRLKPGDIIDIIAPSSAPRGKKWKKGLKILESWGLRPRFSKNALSPWLFHAHKDSRRSELLNRAFASPRSAAVWMLRGGYGLQKLMIPFIKRSKQKKLFIGYSDGTALHLYLNRQGQTTLHAPMICDLPHLPKKDLALLKDVLFGEKKELVFKNLKAFGKGVSSKGKASARILKAPVIGGNLSLLSSSVGAPWFPSLKGHFLFVEDINEEGYRIDRLLRHLLYSGSLQGLRAVLFGSFAPVGPRALMRILNSFSESAPVPLALGLPCGHGFFSPLPFKAPAELSFKGDQACLKVQGL